MAAGSALAAVVGEVPQLVLWRLEYCASNGGRLIGLLMSRLLRRSMVSLSGTTIHNWNEAGLNCANTPAET